MSKMFRLVVLVLLAGGWTLAASAIHVIRTPGQGVPYVPESWGRITVITKDRLGFKDTYADARKWTTADVAARPALEARLNALGKSELLKHVSEPIPAAQPERNDDRDGEPGPIVSR